MGKEECDERKQHPNTYTTLHTTVKPFNTKPQKKATVPDMSRWKHSCEGTLNNQNLLKAYIGR